MSQFDLKNYLVENKLTSNSRVLQESRTYYYDVKADTEEYDELMDTVNDYLLVSSDYLEDGDIDFSSIASLLKSSKLLFEISLKGIDTSTDGIESYYRVTDQETLDKIAGLYAVDEELYELASMIQNGEVNGFMAFTPDFPEYNTFQVFPLESGFEEIEKVAKQHLS